MAASATVPQVSQFRKFATLRHRVLTLYGYGIRVYVNRGHLTIEDGIGIDRRKTRFPRVGHGIRRVVVVGSDGFVSLEALRWLADQDAAFVMLDRDGSVLATTGPVRPSDARLRRAQALANMSGVGLRIAQELISQKLAGQEKLARDGLKALSIAAAIAQFRKEIVTAKTVETLRVIESRAAHIYWSVWRNVPVTFPMKDLERVPEHWRTFGSRYSPLTGSPRLAVNPPNAMLNYLYALLESESRLALAALGLDPGLGMMHKDSPSRDSFACDLMEAVRPNVDAYVLDWILREPLSRKWFFEQRDGNCRLMGSFAMRLSETALTWAHAVAPIAEHVSRAIWSTTRKRARQLYPATRLTQARRRQVKGGVSNLLPDLGPQTPRICRSCGEPLKQGHKFCESCSVEVARENLIEAAKLGRAATHTAKAEALRAATQRRHATALKAWKPTDKQNWLTEEVYRKKIQPRLLEITISKIRAALGVSEPYATDIRSGRRVPHPRHWCILSTLVGVSGVS